MRQISTHAPRAGRNVWRYNMLWHLPNFNSRAPCGAQPKHNARYAAPKPISTHAPRAGRNKYAYLQDVQTRNISTHAPRAGRNYVKHDN